MPEEKITRPKVEYKAEGLRDPFKKLIRKLDKKDVDQNSVPKREEKLQLPQFQIQGIVWGGVFPQAIINNKVVKVGDSIEGCLIKDISKEGVTVDLEGFEYRLSSPVRRGKL
ncbi:MAG: hypothetical protein NC916_02105 [Candidatus Omnitrophica bacterium]|nr:hypothetical protein [Candidatus Omnitrophota bacterium]